jgi:hypothetical protein
MEFCKCGSMIVKGFCSNKKCKEHGQVAELATYRQMNYIKSLCTLLDKDEPENLIHMTKVDASSLIKEYEELLELAN